MTHVYVDNCEKLNARNYANKFLSICKDNFFIIAVIIGVIFGIVAGLFLRQYDLSHDTLVLIEYPGELFLRSLELLILPFIITCIITGTANLNIRENKQIAVYTILIFFSLALFNVALGMCFGMLVPTSPPDITEEFTIRPEDSNLMDGFLDLGRNIIPTNLFQATFSNTFTRVDYWTDENTGETTVKKKLDFRQSTNMMGLLVFCTAFGFVLGTMDQKKQVLLEFFSVLYEATQKLLVGAIWFTPVGTASIVCSKIAAIPQLSETINQLSCFFFLITAGLLMYAMIILPMLLFVITKRNPYKYFLALMPAIICSFSTATKSTVVPMAMQLLVEKTDANKKVTKFVLPIGIINLNGTAFFLGFSIVFLSHRYGIDFTGSDIINLWLGCTFLSMSGASIPSASIVLLITLCGTAGIPPENVGILIALDWILDRIRTVNNLLGDVFTVAVVQHISRDHLVEKSSTKEKKSVNGKCDDRMQHENLQIHRDSPIITKTEMVV